jgi:hypothetical protein
MSIYVKIYENKMYLKNTKNGKEYTLSAYKDFSYKGLLIANIDNAIECMKSGLEQIKSSIQLLKPKIYIQLMKNIEEITQAEEHAILEVGYKAGARELILIKNEDDVKD